MNKLTLDWENFANGTWKTNIGNEKAKTLLDFVGVSPKIELINLLSKQNFPFSDDIKAYISNDKLVVCIPLEDDERLYGGGLNYKKSIINFSVLHLKSDHYGGRDNGRTHAPVPFYISSKGYGVFINTPNYVDMYCGSANRVDSKKGYRNLDRNTNKNWTASVRGEYVEISVSNVNSLEVVLFAGENMLEVVQRYNLYCGGGFIPPKWGLGLWKRMPTTSTDEDVYKNINEFKEHGFDLNVIGLEPGWQSCAYPCSYEWNSKWFPKPKQFVDKAFESGVRINLWENPYISPDSKIFEDILQFCCSHTVWGGVVPDYTMQQARDVYMKQHKENHVDIGISGYKIDECDGHDAWLWPDHAEFPSGTTAEQMRNLYGVLIQKMTFDIYKEKNIRTYGLVRATNAGGNSLPYVLYNDCYDFHEFFTGLCNCGFIGAMWVPEVRGAKTADEWLKRCQLVSFSPMAMINSWSSGMEPWSFEEVTENVKEVFLLRKQMLPYYYSAFNDYEFKGIPPFRSIVLEYDVKEKRKKGTLDDTENPYEIDAISSIIDQFMVGNCLMVAPFCPEQHERSVILPKDDWYDFYTGDFVGNNCMISINDDDKRIPVYVKDGGIVPFNDLDDNIIKLHYYGNKMGKFCLYDDDGESFDYQKGINNTIIVSVSRDSIGKANLTINSNKNTMNVKSKNLILIDMSII